MNDDSTEPRIFRILSLDGGGAKGFYTLGALKEIEALVSCPLCEKFDLICQSALNWDPRSASKKDPPSGWQHALRAPADCVH